MASICFYFQVHQPFRLKEYDFSQIGEDHFYEDDQLNQSIFEKVAANCYLPMNSLMLELIEKHKGAFKFALGISGTAIEQMERYAPVVLASFQKLVATGCVELLAETYFHSLVGLYEPGDFSYQVNLHSSKIEEHFGYRPKTFRNTELIVSNSVIQEVAKLGFEQMVVELPLDVADAYSVNQIYPANANPDLLLLPRNTPLSDDIAFRFSDPNWSGYPMLTSDFAKKLHGQRREESIGLFMDYETFGEHRKPETGIFEFMKHLPEEVMKDDELVFELPSEIAAKASKNGKPKIDYPEITSWASEQKDYSSWMENELQKDAWDQIMELQPVMYEQGTLGLMDLWRKLTTSDHFYYMSTKYKDDPVHQVFSHYPSPFDAYINYMNVLSDIKRTVGLR